MCNVNVAAVCSAAAAFTLHNVGLHDAGSQDDSHARHPRAPSNASPKRSHMTVCKLLQGLPEHKRCVSAVAAYSAGAWLPSCSPHSTAAVLLLATSCTIHRASICLSCAQLGLMLSACLPPSTTPTHHPSMAVLQLHQLSKQASCCHIPSAATSPTKPHTDLPRCAS
jgi:hypothetical protein